mgnify:CR=1 FL=1
MTEPTPRNKGLIVNFKMGLLYGDTVKQFDELLTNMRCTYIKTFFHSSVHGHCYEFIILGYEEQEKILSFLSSSNDSIFTRKPITLTDEEMKVLKGIILK